MSQMPEKPKEFTKDAPKDAPKTPERTPTDPVPDQTEAPEPKAPIREAEEGEEG